MVIIVWTYVEVVRTLGRAQRNVFRLSLHATANGHREPSSTKNRQQQDRLKTTREGQLSRWFSAMSRPASVKPVDGPSESLDRSNKERSVFSGGREVSSGSSSSFAAAAAAAAALEVTETSRKRSSRSDSLWKRMLLGSIVEDIEGERNVSPDRARQQERGESSPSPASSISYTRSNSNVSVKNWLWSTSRDLGIFGENESLDESSEEEACTNVLWLNGMSSPTRRRLSSGVKMMTGPIFTATATSSKRLKTSKETERGDKTGGVAVVDDGDLCESSTSSMRTPKMTQREKLSSKVGATKTVGTAGGTVATPSVAMHDSNTPSHISSPAQDRDGSHIDPLVTAATAGNGSPEVAGGGNNSSGNNNKNNLKGSTAMLAPPMPTKSRLSNGVASARGYVRRMSSIDTDYGDVVFGNKVIRAGRSGPADWNRQGFNRSMSGKFATPTAVTPGVPGGREHPSPRNNAPEKDMDRFISRIKW